ncbi:MAG: hypothetical protein ACLR6B_10065 [Blautia sp.]
MSAEQEGDLVAVPCTYIKNGLGKLAVAGFFYSLFGVLTVFGTGNATQVNTITTAIDTALGQYSLIGDTAMSMLNLHHWYFHCHAGGNGASRRH